MSDMLFPFKGSEPLLDKVFDGLEVTNDGYDIWVVYRDSGSWWCGKRNSRDHFELSSCSEDSAKELNKLGYWKA